MGNCCEYQVNYIKTHLTLILIAVYKDNQQGEQMRCFLTPFSLQTNKCMFRKAGNYHHNHSSEMTRLQDETKEESLTLMGRPSKAHIFFQYIVYAILKRKRALLQGDQSVVYLLKKIELLFSAAKYSCFNAGKMQYPDNGCGELIETLLRLLKAFLSNNVCASSWSNLGPKVLTISG